MIFLSPVVATTTSVVDGSLLVEYETSESAYDAISEKISTFFDVDYFNGTEIYGRLIADFKQVSFDGSFCLDFGNLYVL